VKKIFLAGLVIFAIFSLASASSGCAPSPARIPLNVTYKVIIDTPKYLDTCYFTNEPLVILESKNSVKISEYYFNAGDCSLYTTKRGPFPPKIFPVPNGYIDVDDKGYVIYIQD